MHNTNETYEAIKFNNGVDNLKEAKIPKNNRGSWKQQKTMKHNNSGRNNHKTEKAIS